MDRVELIWINKYESLNEEMEILKDQNSRSKSEY